jgi:hypothetical protein
VVAHLKGKGSMKRSDLMPIEFIDDWEKRIERQDAFWDNQIIDRPVINISCPCPNPDFPAPAKKTFTSHREHWFDAEYVAAQAIHQVMNTQYYGDNLPKINPNLGPEVFSAFFGMEMEYGKTTSWGIPNLGNWDDVDKLQFSENNVYFKKMVELTDALLAVGKNRFYVGLTDFHPGGDGITAFRDPMNLNFDMIECPEKVKQLAVWLAPEYFKIFDYFYDKLQQHNQATTNWAGIVSNKKWYVPSNDFSCMISKEMFDTVFLPGITEECRQLDAALYHLDGPDALRHLDSLLSIKELNAIQWVYGAGNGRATDWLHIHKKCQAAGKGVQIGVFKDELDIIIDNLKPEGVWLSVWDVNNSEEAETIIKKVKQWK